MEGAHGSCEFSVSSSSTMARRVTKPEEEEMGISRQGFPIPEQTIIFPASPCKAWILPLISDFVNCVILSYFSNITFLISDKVPSFVPTQVATPFNLTVQSPTI